MLLMFAYRGNIKKKIAQYITILGKLIDERKT